MLSNEFVRPILRKISKCAARILSDKLRDCTIIARVGEICSTPVEFEKEVILDLCDNDIAEIMEKSSEKPLIIAIHELHKAIMRGSHCGFFSFMNPHTPDHSAVYSVAGLPGGVVLQVGVKHELAQYIFSCRVKLLIF